MGGTEKKKEVQGERWSEESSRADPPRYPGEEELSTAGRL